MAIVNQYFSTLPSVRYVFKSGVTAHFIHGRYRTDKKAEIAELDEEIELGNPYFYTKPGAKEVDTINDDPMIGLKQKIIADFLAEQKNKEVEQSSGTKESKSVQTPIKPASSDVFIPVAATSKSSK